VASQLSMKASERKLVEEKRYEQMMDLGRQARDKGFGVGACSLDSTDVARSFWLAGWHDRDREIIAEHRYGKESFRHSDFW